MPEIRIYGYRFNEFLELRTELRKAWVPIEDMIFLITQNNLYCWHPKFKIYTDKYIGKLLGIPIYLRSD
jgi:hypothetical protein